MYVCKTTLFTTLFMYVCKTTQKCMHLNSCSFTASIYNTCKVISYDLVLQSPAISIGKKYYYILDMQYH